MPDGVERIAVGQIDGTTDWTSALVGCDVVFHLAAGSFSKQDGVPDPLAECRKINVVGTDRLARCAAASGVKRFVHISTIKVNGESTAPDRPFVESDTPAPVDAYGISKWEGERALWDAVSSTGMTAVVIRPPLVYGHGAKGNFEQLMRTIARGFPLPLGSIRNQRDFIFVGNLIDACMICAVHAGAAGQTFLVCDGQALSTPELLRTLARAMGVRSSVLPFPVSVMRFAGAALGKSEAVRRLLGSLQVDSGKIRRVLGWTPPYTLEQGFFDAAATHSSH